MIARRVRGIYLRLIPLEIPLEKKCAQSGYAMQGYELERGHSKLVVPVRSRYMSGRRQAGRGGLAIGSGPEYNMARTGSTLLPSWVHELEV